MTELTTVYHKAYFYLEHQLDELNRSESGAEILRKEFDYYGKNKAHTLNDVYRRMLFSLINRQGFPNFIGLGSIDKISDILFDYDARCVYMEYGNDFERLFSRIKERFPEKSIDIQRQRSAWYQFTTGIISASKFLSTIDSFEEFDAFVDSFSYNEYTVAALPMLLEKEIFGFGFALACDFLKEAGYTNYGKPDVHLIEIFEGVGIVQDRSVFETFKTIVKMAREVDESPVVVDKLFWLIGSGKFHHSADGDGRLDGSHYLFTGRKRQEFIEYYKLNQQKAKE